MLLVAVTGSLGAGKSKVASTIAIKAEAPLFNADLAVHELYLPGGKAVDPVARRFAGVLDSEGGIDRKKLSESLAADPDGFKDLNAIVHPLVGEARREFLEQCKDSIAWMVILDIPLLLEGGTTDKGGADIVIVVDAPEATRRERLRQRSNMSDEKFDMLESKQLPVKDKRALADYIIDNEGDWRKIEKNIAAMLKEAAFQKRDIP
ncbi:MAG: dephospho-CoA kinase [Hyphomicrobiales bacterium]|nr:dephospho-CoA kinase [Hyphomicrobiales bacterium]MCY4033168.1 dephospho-CoA kinase [Hyphomicrobiales bacterium]MCY4038017.1 dephospho-CoA kinase [Hyphomicrobiales bacterium]